MFMFAIAPSLCSSPLHKVFSSILDPAVERPIRDGAAERFDQRGLLAGGGRRGVAGDGKQQRRQQQAEKP
jgi:hypothetical protein